jgi:hypothetical protein
MGIDTLSIVHYFHTNLICKSAHIQYTLQVVGVLIVLCCIFLVLCVSMCVWGGGREKCTRVHVLRPYLSFCYNSFSTIEPTQYLSTEYMIDSDFTHHYHPLLLCVGIQVTSFEFSFNINLHLDND